MPTKLAMPRDAVHLGLDVAKDSIAVGILRPGDRMPDSEKIFHDEESVRRLVGRLGRPEKLWACYEAGPTGYELHRLLTSLRVRCDVIAPSLIPKGPGDKVKTDKRDCRRLAKLHRAGELTAIRVPTVAEEGVRDICRARRVAIAELLEARQRLSSFLLRHSVVWRGGSTWTHAHRQWMATRSFEDPSTQAAYGFYRAEAATAEATVKAIEVEMEPMFEHPSFIDAVQRLSAYRGINKLGALTLASEIVDWRRFPTAGCFMGFCGLVPREYSTGASVRRGRITAAGNADVRRQLVESAWAYRYQANLTIDIARRQVGAAPETVARAWNAQLRLARRFRQLDQRKSARQVVVTAIARELSGFVWAEMTA